MVEIGWYHIVYICTSYTLKKYEENDEKSLQKGENKGEKVKIGEYVEFV